MVRLGVVKRTYVPLFESRITISHFIGHTIRYLLERMSFFRNE